MRSPEALMSRDQGSGSRLSRYESRYLGDQLNWIPGPAFPNGECFRAQPPQGMRIPLVSVSSSLAFVPPKCPIGRMLDSSIPAAVNVPKAATNKDDSLALTRWASLCPAYGAWEKDISSAAKSQ